MNSKLLYLLVFAIFCISDTKTTTCHPRKATYFYGIRPSDPGGLNGLANPERGINLDGPSNNIFLCKENYSINSVLAGFEQQSIRSIDGVTLIQGYCVLQTSKVWPIRDGVITSLQNNLKALRIYGWKATMRVIYNEWTNPSWTGWHQHIKQLGPIFSTYSDVIAHFETGMANVYGENPNGEEANFILRQEMAYYPTDRFISERRPWRKRNFVRGDTLSNYTTSPLLTYTYLNQTEAFGPSRKARIGFFDDYFVGDNGCCGGYDYQPATVDSMQVIAEGYWLPFRGEGLYNVATQPFNIAQHAYLYHVDSLENTVPLTLMRYNLNYTMIQNTNMMNAGSGYFGDDDSHTRTLYEYLRDHLGYRIELQNLTTQICGSSLYISLTLINKGMSSCYNPRLVYFVFISLEQGSTETYSFQVHSDPRNWHPYQPQPRNIDYTPIAHVVSATIPLGTNNNNNNNNNMLPYGNYQLGVWLPDPKPTLINDYRYAIRVANRGVSYQVDPSSSIFGVNILTTIQIIDSS